MVSLSAFADTAELAVRSALRSGATEAQAAAFYLDEGLTRFANSQIHQNVSSWDAGVAITVALRKRIGQLRIKTLVKKEVLRAVKQAISAAKASQPNQNFKGFPAPEKIGAHRNSFDAPTAKAPPSLRAESVGALIKQAHSKSATVKAVAGSFSTGSAGYAIESSSGISAQAKISTSRVAVTVISEDSGSEGFGYSFQVARSVKELDPQGVTREAADKSVRALHAIRVEPGDYETILSPEAISLAFTYMGFLGFSAVPYQDGISFVKHNLNQLVFDEQLTVIDDAGDSRTLFDLAIDGEGLPKRPVALIDRGAVNEGSICYDSYTAGKEQGKKSTGHALPPIVEAFRSVPLPLNIVVQPGNSGLDTMIKDTRRGLFVTRFHYVRSVNTTKMVLTGLTRDGTFLVENGELKKPVMNLRFTDSLLNAFKRIKAIGAELKRTENGAFPYMKLEKFRFTGATEY